MYQVEELEQKIEDVKYLKEQSDKAIRLSKYPEFRELILEGFCRDDAARLCSVAGDPAVNKDERKVAADMSRAGGHLKRFLNAIIRQANTAINDLPAMEEALAEARAAQSAGENQQADFTTLGGEPVYDESQEG